MDPTSHLDPQRKPFAEDEARAFLVWISARMWRRSMDPMEEAISSNNCKKPMACFTGWLGQPRLFQPITEGNVMIHFLNVFSCTSLHSLDEPGAFFSTDFSTCKINATVSPIYLRKCTWLFCVGTNLNPRLPDIDVNRLAKEQIQLANHLAHASPCSLIALVAEDAFCGGNFMLWWYSQGWRTQRFGIKPLENITNLLYKTYPSLLFFFKFSVGNIT